MVSFNVDVVIPDFSICLGEFLREQVSVEYDFRYNELVENSINNKSDIDESLSKLGYVVTTNNSTLIKNLSDEDIFARYYHRLIHSTASNDIIQLEHSFAIAVASELQKRNTLIDKMKNELVYKTEQHSARGGTDVAQLITELQEEFYRTKESVEISYNSVISEMKLEQKNALRQFVMSDQKQSEKKTKDRKFLHTNKNWSERRSFYLTRQSTQIAPWAETFSVLLGRQLRATCSFRLIQMDPDDLLTGIGHVLENNKPIDDLPERLINALTIYSNNLNGLVLIVDKRLNSAIGTRKYLFDACEQSTEFHFSELGVQIASILDTINNLEPQNSLNIKSTQGVCEPAHGDVYITKHSNLIGGHANATNIIFHLVIDDNFTDSIRASSPLHCALSAILRICFYYDITTLSLPLLVTSKLNTSTDQVWRSKRAELVFKAIKSALMELITWHGPTLRLIQFLAPPDSSLDELNSYGQIITTSFMQLNPLINSN